MADWSLPNGPPRKDVPTLPGKPGMPLDPLARPLPSSGRLKLSSGLNERLSRLESGKTNERSGGGFGAGAEKAALLAGGRLVAVGAEPARVGVDVGGRLGGTGRAGVSVALAAEDEVVASAAVAPFAEGSSSPATCVVRKLEAYGEP
jgi:hypothetical protein